MTVDSSQVSGHARRIQTRAERRRLEDNATVDASTANDSTATPTVEITTTELPTQTNRQTGRTTRVQVPLSDTQHWPRDHAGVLKRQTGDPVLSEVRSWLISGAKPNWNELKTDRALRCYFQMTFVLYVKSFIVQNDP